MTEHSLNELSMKRMDGLHPDLQGVVKRAIELAEADFEVVEGMRTLDRQKTLVEKGKSTTMNSRHLTGHAIDLVAIVDGKMEWGAPYHDQIANAMKAAAAEKNVDVEWGGDWTSFVDTPHFQLSWKSYPKQDENWKPQPKGVQKAATKVAKGAVKAPVSTSIGFGSVGVVLDWLFGWVDPLLAFMQQTVAAMAKLGPVKTMLLEAGANTHAIGGSLLILAITVVLKKMLAEDD